MEHAAGPVWLIAEDLLLLILDDARGVSAGGVDVRLAMGGGLLMDLAEAGLVSFGPRTGLLSSPRVDVTDDAVTDDDVLAAALAVVADGPRDAMSTVPALARLGGRPTADVLAERLARRGVLERREGRVLGLFPRTEWPMADAGHETAMRRGLRHVLLDGGVATAREDALIAVLQALSGLRVAVGREGGVSEREVAARATRARRESAERGPAAHAVAVAEVAAAVTAAAVIGSGA
ncbi:GOLPH3/VPS74 family protein [Microbacterium gorillae]|uniref:GOLPH3/VPS74 family protein n=1 Tax=Microbacterium gorillae TaxID=1231063 RepID=UPI00058E4F6B|nr:GPP34 family phosphoprotein [Microbacterium gorillae]